MNLVIVSEESSIKYYLYSILHWKKSNGFSLVSAAKGEFLVSRLPDRVVELAGVRRIVGLYYRCEDCILKLVMASKLI